MTEPIEHVGVRHYYWKHRDGTSVPMIRIDAGRGFAMIPYSMARTVVDEVHDLCDAHEAKARKEQNS